MKRQFLFIIPLLLQSCSSMYIPANRSIPLLEKKGEFQGETGISTNSLYFNSSYAFSNDIAASLNGNLSYRNFSNKYDLFTHKDDSPPGSGGFFGPPPDRRGKFEHRYWEASMGKMNMLPRFPVKLEMFGGIGTGKATDIDYFDNDNRYKSNYTSLFVQGNYGMKKRNIEAGGSMRLAYSGFNYSVDRYTFDVEEYILFQDKFNVLHVEPLLFVRVGKGNLKFVYRVGLNLALTLDPLEKYAGYRGLNNSGKLDNTVFHISIGLSYRIQGK